MDTRSYVYNCKVYFASVTHSEAHYADKGMFMPLFLLMKMIFPPSFNKKPDISD